MITQNNPDGADRSVFDDLVKALEPAGVTYVKGQLEVGAESATPHLQAYAEFKGQQKMKRLIGLMKGMHLEKRMGSQGQAIDYVTKMDTRTAGPWEHGKPRKQGERTDIKAASSAIKDGASWADLADEHPGVVMKYTRGVGKLKSIYDKADSAAWREVDVDVIYGETGTGKTRGVLYDEDGSRKDGVYVLTCASDTLWFDGYDGEQTLLIDEFTGWIKYAFLLRLLDGHQTRLPVKGGFGWARWTRVVLTSNAEPETWYKRGMTPALRRRLHRYYADKEPSLVLMDMCAHCNMIPDYCTCL